MFVTCTIATRPIPHPRWPHDPRALIANVGDLVVTADNTTRAEVAQRLHERRAGWYWATMFDLFEGYYCNGSFEPFDAGLANPYVGLTDTACIAESMDYPDEPLGSPELPQDREIVGRLWFFDNWALADPLEQLRNHGRTVFRLAGEDTRVATDDEDFPDLLRWCGAVRGPDGADFLLVLPDGQLVREGDTVVRRPTGYEVRRCTSAAASVAGR
jgi:hypothetical protein